MRYAANSLRQCRRGGHAFCLSCRMEVVRDHVFDSSVLRSGELGDCPDAKVKFGFHMSATWRSLFIGRSSTHSCLFARIPDSVGTSKCRKCALRASAASAICGIGSHSSGPDAMAKVQALAIVSDPSQQPVVPVRQTDPPSNESGCKKSLCFVLVRPRKAGLD